MKRRVLKRPSALRDIEEIGEYIGRDNARAEFRFYKAIETTSALLARTPWIGRAREFRNPELADVRSIGAGRFRNYLIFYRVDQNTIEIIRVIHGARDLERALGGATSASEPDDE